MSVEDWKLHRPDDVLLRRFGHVRAVGGIAWFVIVVVLALRYGWEVWPLALGVPLLAVVTTWYFVRSEDYPRTLVTVSLVADAFVLAGAIAYFGGTGSGLVLLYSIVVVSAGLLLGPSSAIGFTVMGVMLGFAQLGIEQLGLTPEVLYRPDLGDRLPILLASCAGLVSVGYLSGTYASRLHELIAIAGAEAEQVRAKGRRRRGYVRQAAADVTRRLRELERLAAESNGVQEGMTEEAAARLRLGVAELEAAVEELGDAAALDGVGEMRPEPVRLAPIVEDCRRALANRLEVGRVSCDVGDLKVVGHPGALRRIVVNLLDNVSEHTPPGTRAHVAARPSAGHCVLAVTDAGPGVPQEAVPTLFEPAGGRAKANVGLPLVAELVEAMGGTIRYEPVPSGGSRFLVTLRLAPTAAPTAQDEGVGA